MLTVTRVYSKGKSNKIVYLEIDSETNNDESLFAGLILEDRVDLPQFDFKKILEPAPFTEIKLSPSLRDYIIVHKRENITVKDTREE